MTSSYSAIREFVDVQTAKLKARAEAWDRALLETSRKIIAAILTDISRRSAHADGYRRARRKYGYRRFPSRRGRP